MKIIIAITFLPRPALPRFDEHIFPSRLLFAFDCQILLAPRAAD
jgi:hypothetical protein